MVQAITIPGGRHKGQLLTEADDRELSYWAREGRNDTIREAAAAELARRGGGDGADGGAAPAAPAAAPAARPASAQSRAMAPRQANGGALTPPSHAEMTVHRDVEGVNAMLAQASQQAHLVSPVSRLPALPEGTNVALTYVYVDVESETYGLPGTSKRGLGKAALDKIASAAGLTWDLDRTGRVDDASDPHYCHYRAVGRVRDVDGSERVVSGEVEIDMRETSAQVETLREKARAKQRSADGQIGEIRQFIIRHAESKAKLRATRSLGIRTAYEPRELERPFAIAKLLFTGESDDPQLRRDFARMNAERMLGARSSLYPAQRDVVEAPALPAARPHAARSAPLPPPPPGERRVTPTDDDDNGPPSSGRF